MIRLSELRSTALGLDVLLACVAVIASLMFDDRFTSPAGRLLIYPADCSFSAQVQRRMLI
jgi:hypothetical protein